MGRGVLLRPEKAQTMKVAIYSLTRDRLQYTRHCFEMLRLMAGYPYDHYIIDNASTDGTVEWLRESVGLFAGVYLNPKNYGNCVGNNQAVSMIGDSYDLIIRMDNDCEVQTKNLLASIVDIYTSLKKFNTWTNFIISPKVTGIVNQPKREGSIKVGNWELGLVAIVGGLFRVTSAPLVKEYVWPVDMSIVAGEECIATWHKGRGGYVCYAEDLIVYHYETTGGQAQKFPEYHKRKIAEWNDLPDGDFRIPEPR